MKRHTLIRMLLLMIALIAVVPSSRIFAVAHDASTNHASTNLLDINTATPEQLKALPGFGDAYVRRVIAGRPYTAKNQLVTRGVLPQSAYDKVSSRIIAKHPAR